MNEKYRNVSHLRRLSVHARTNVVAESTTCSSSQNDRRPRPAAMRLLVRRAASVLARSATRAASTSASPATRAMHQPPVSSSPGFHPEHLAEAPAGFMHVPVALGLAGAIPFVALAAPLAPALGGYVPAGMFPVERRAEAQAKYGAAIVSFLGGMHWGSPAVREKPAAGASAAKGLCCWQDPRASRGRWFQPARLAGAHVRHAVRARRRRRVPRRGRCADAGFAAAMPRWLMPSSGSPASPSSACSRPCPPRSGRTTSRRGARGSAARGRAGPRQALRARDRGSPRAKSRRRVGRVSPRSRRARRAADSRRG